MNIILCCTLKEYNYNNTKAAKSLGLNRTTLVEKMKRYNLKTEDTNAISKSLLSKAIKNAQSRFGVAADIYQKRESEPTNQERERYTSMCRAINTISSSRVQLFKEQWASLGTDWSEFLDKWQVYIDNNSDKG